MRDTKGKKKIESELNDKEDTIGTIDAIGYLN